MSWIGVDLDGTLAEYHGDVSTIGPPVKPMFARVQRWIREGRTVKIVTARASQPHQVRMIKEWLSRVGLPPLEVTDRKDFGMVELWDDRAVQVTHNKGIPVNYLEQGK